MFLAMLSVVLIALLPFLQIPTIGNTGIIGVETTYATTTADKITDEKNKFKNLEDQQKLEIQRENLATKIKDLKTEKASLVASGSDTKAIDAQITTAESELKTSEKKNSTLSGGKYTEKQITNAIEGSKDLKKKISEFAALFVSIFTPIIAIFAKIIGSLMGDEFLMGGNSAGGKIIADVLYELWLVFRDIMNYIFILILLIIAFMNIISPLTNSDSYALKTTLPKLILAIVVINLTWFGARVTFDVVQIATQVVFGLPQAIGEKGYMPEECKVINTTKEKKIEGICNPIKIIVDLKKGIKNGNSTFDPDNVIYSDNVKKEKADIIANIKKNIKEVTNSNVSNKTDLLETYQKQLDGINSATIKGSVDYGPVVIYWADFNYDQFNEGTIAPLFAFSMLQVQNLPQIAQNAVGDEGPGWSSLLINAIMALVLMIIIIALLFMMMVSLFFRIIILWANIIASPFLGLMMFSEELKIGVPGEASEYLGLGAFLKHAFAPAIMGFPLVIGFIMINAARKGGINVSNGLELQGTPIISNLSNIHEIFFYGLTIAVMWVGGVQAIKFTTAGFIQESIINPIADGVTGAAKFIAKAPMYITFIPVANDGDPNTNDKVSLKNVFDSVPLIGNQWTSKKDNDFRNRLIGKDNPLNNIKEKSENSYTLINSLGAQGNKDFIKELEKARNDVDVRRILEKKQHGYQILEDIEQGKITPTEFVNTVLHSGGIEKKIGTLPINNLINNMNKLVKKSPNAPATPATSTPDAAKAAAIKTITENTPAAGAAINPTQRSAITADLDKAYNAVKGNSADITALTRELKNKFKSKEIQKLIDDAQTKIEPV